MVVEIRPDKKGTYYPDDFKVFLAGTIDNGDSEDWQEKLIHMMDDELKNRFLIAFNPRRKNWDANAGSDAVEKQIKWEEDRLDESDLIVMVIKEGSKSPISLLELGLYGPSGRMIVFCNDKFYRYTNVKMTCEKYLIPLVNSTDVKDICNEIKKVVDEIWQTKC